MARRRSIGRDISLTSTRNLGVSATVRQLRELGDHVVQAAKDALQQGAEEIVNDAKSRCPVKLGTLRDSIKSKPNNDGSVYRISASAENNGFDYAPIIEYAPYGTPFMKPAYEANINRIYNNIRTSIRQATETGHA